MSKKLKCHVSESTGFEMALDQLGYTVIDSEWKGNYMHYTVIKKGD